MNDKDRSAVLVMTATAPGLVLRLALSYLRMKQHAKRARRTFLTELRSSGMPSWEAGRLADDYAEAVSLTNMIRQLSRSG